LPSVLQSDPTMLWGCVAGATPAERIENWLASVRFVDICITPKPESRELIMIWAFGRNLERHIVSAMVEAGRPTVKPSPHGNSFFGAFRENRPTILVGGGRRV
jgi:hypothetical protein